MKKDELWSWNEQKSKLFQEVKIKFTEKPILKIYQSELPIRVKTDALDFVLKACLLQKYSKVWHPVAYYS